MPVNAKGRLRYPDFLSTFSSEKAATPPTADSSVKAQRGSSVSEVVDGSGSAAPSPTHDLKAALKPPSHPCVSPPLGRATISGAPKPQTPLDLRGLEFPGGR